MRSQAAGLGPAAVTVAACVVGSIAAAALRGHWPAWAVMWAAAVFIFAAFKVITWLATPQRLRGTWAPYLFTWVGMDPAGFARRAGPQDRPTPARWALAVSNLLLGGFVILIVAPRVARVDAFTGAWVAMGGFILALHCGALALLALAWRAAGRDVRPIMDRPLAARSVGDFWSGRWNRAFTDSMRRCVMLPVARRFGAAQAFAAVFILSGLLHEMLISIPAGGGYGIPTAYFALQACAIAFERSAIGRTVLTTAAARRAFAWLIVAGPAVWLFSPWFVARIVLPFMHVIGTAPTHQGAFDMTIQGLDMTTALILAGLLHFGILLAAALVPLKLGWRRELAALPTLTRQLIWTHGGFIVLVIIGFGTLTLATAGELASGGALARAVCGLIAVFWTARIAVGLTVFDLAPVLTSPALRFGERALMGTFVYLAVVYAAAALA